MSNNENFQKYARTFYAYIFMLFVNIKTVLLFLLFFFRNEPSNEEDEDHTTYTLTFTLTFPHIKDTVYIAHCFPYRYYTIIFNLTLPHIKDIYCLHCPLLSLFYNSIIVFQTYNRIAYHYHKSITYDSMTTLY